MTLSGKRILITRSKEKATILADKLRARGALPIIFPTIEIAPLRDAAPLDCALQDLPRYDWLVLTSANAVEAVWERLKALGVDRLPRSLRVAAIGPQTARSLQAKAVNPDFVPGKFLGEAILPGLGELRGQRVLLPLADLAPPTLPQAIRAVGGHADVVIAYHTLPARPNNENWQALRDGVDVITFTSGSTVENFIAILQAAGLDLDHIPGPPLIACIGPKTAKIASEAGLAVDILPEDYTVEGLILAIERYFASEKK